MFNIVQKKRELKEQERQAAAALGKLGISDYGMNYFDATYRKGGFTIVQSGRFLYCLNDDGQLLEVYAGIAESPMTPEEFATLLDGLFAALLDNPFVVVQEASR